MPESRQKLGKYEIREELGKGAMGVVYLAYDPVLEREVALKVMASTIVSDKELKERFEREAKAVARLQHPNIVTVYDLGYDEEGSPFIAMELLKGDDLETRMRNKPPAFVEKLEIIMQVCRGLSHAHANGIVHRDIKPANIFVTTGKDVKIMDFGVARWMQSSQTQTGAILGTADYMSPEQIRGHKVDGRSDIFSVGVILYRLLTKKKPFKGENIQSVFFKILNSDPPELQLPDGSTIPELQTIVDRAMAKDAGARYTTADEMAEDINQFLHKYHGAVSDDTVFDTAFDPGIAVDHDTSGRGRRPGTLRPRTGTGAAMGTSPAGVSRTFRPTSGTAAPPTSLGQATGGTIPQVRPTAVVPPTRLMRGPRPVPQERKSPLFFVALLLLVLAGAGGGIYWYVNNQSDNQPTATTADLESRFQFAEEALKQGQLSQAFDSVQNILLLSPNNERALALQEKIQQALEQQKPKPPSPTSVPPTAEKTAGPSPAERAQQFREEALMALANNDVTRARDLIAQGEKLTPADSRWSQLKEQLAGKEAQIRQQGLAQQRERLIAGYLKQAADAVAAEDYDKAVQAYDAILEHDSNHQGAITGKTAAINLKRQLEMEQQRQAELRQAATAFNRDIIDSPTEYAAAPGKDDGPKGFEAGGGVNVKRATAAPSFPASVTIELNPTNAQPGQPYVVRVRLNNEGTQSINVKFLELISSYGGKSIGRGQHIPPKVQRISPKATVLLHEVTGTWTEEQNKGSITARVTLVGDATLTKVISW